MCFKMLMWTILVLGSYLQGAYAQSDKTTSSTSTYTKTISNTTLINSSLVESSSQSIPSTISITTIITSKLPSAENSTAGPTIPAKTEASGTSTNSIPTDPQSATVSTNIPEFKDTSKISTLASNTQFPSTNVTASTILTSEVTKGTDAPSDQSNSPETVTISRPTELHLTTNKESLVNHITADGISTTNSKTETATTAATTSAAAAAATTTSAKATTITAAATTSAKATTTSAAAATVAAPAATTTRTAATTTRTAATTTRTAATRTTTRTAAAAAARNTTSTITTTSIKPQPQAMEPKLIPYLQMEITPNSSGNNYEKLCALLIKINRKTVNCTMNGHEIDGVFRVESIQLPSLPSVKDQKHPTPATPTKPVDSGEPTEKQGEDTQMTLIAILASCGALALILIAFAVYCSCHRLSYRKNQQHLTEELQTIENGYHDNPTLEVMEVQPEVQEKKFALEKKLALNGEFNDSWIVPFDNLAKEDIPDEEDTHL